MTNKIYQNNAVGIYNTIPTNPPKYYKIEQSYSNITYIAAVKRIIITTNSIPINSEFLPGKINDSLNPQFPVLSDYVPTIQKSEDIKSVVYYIPTAQYRLIDMINSFPLYRININVYWLDIYNNIFPLSMPPFNQASIKIAFLKKSLYKIGLLK